MRLGVGTAYVFPDLLVQRTPAGCTPDGALRKVSMLKLGEQVEVVGLAPQDECESEMFVWIAPYRHSKHMRH